MLLNRTEQPLIKNATDFTYTLQPYTLIHLQNNIPVYYVNAGTQDIVQIEWVFDAGTWYNTENTVAQSVGGLFKNGTSTQTALQINEAIDLYGANVKLSVGNDMATLSLSCMSKHATNLLPLIFELLTDSIFPESEIEIYKLNSLQRLSVSLKKCDFVANRLIDEYIFGYQHPYGHYNTKEDVENIQQQALVNFLKTYYCFDNCKLFIAGKFKDTLLKDIDTIFGKVEWNRNQNRKIITVTPAPASQKKYRVNNDPTGVQGAVRMAMPFVPKQHADFVPMVVLNTLFGGYFGSRLMSNIREDKGYTYGIYSYVYNNKYDTAFAITTEAGKDVCEQTVQEVYNEIEKIKTQAIPNEELQLVKNYLLGGILGSVDGPFQTIQRWKNLLLYGFDINRFNNNIEIYKNITTTELQELANKYFINENFYELVVI